MSDVLYPTRLRWEHNHGGIAKLQAGCSFRLVLVSMDQLRLGMKVNHRM